MDRYNYFLFFYKTFDMKKYKIFHINFPKRKGLLQDSLAIVLFLIINLKPPYNSLGLMFSIDINALHSLNTSLNNSGDLNGLLNITSLLNFN